MLKIEAYHTIIDASNSVSTTYRCLLSLGESVSLSVFPSILGIVIFDERMLISNVEIDLDLYSIYKERRYLARPYYFPYVF